MKIIVDRGGGRKIERYRETEMGSGKKYLLTIA
jgi:hypothetical protein